MNAFTSFSETLLALFSANPSVLVLQCTLLGAGLVVTYLVLFATRDILLRTHSFLYQLVCILLVAALPIVGFLLYLLIRPPRTIAERELKRDMEQILARMHSHQHPKGQRPQEKSKSDKK